MLSEVLILVLMEYGLWLNDLKKLVESLNGS